MVSPCQQVFHMSNQESLHYRLQMYVIYPLKLWVKSILKDKKQTAIKKKKKRVYKETLRVSQVSQQCEDIVLILSLVKNGRLLCLCSYLLLKIGNSNKTFIHFCVNHCPIYFVPFSSFVKVFVLLCCKSIGLQAWSLDNCTKKKRPEDF